MDIDRDSQTKYATTVEVEQKDDIQPVRDYAGCVEKTDPKEIELVRKLDMIFLVSASQTLGPHTETCCSHQ